MEWPAAATNECAASSAMGDADNCATTSAAKCAASSAVGDADHCATTGDTANANVVAEFHSDNAKWMWRYEPRSLEQQEQERQQRE